MAYPGGTIVNPAVPYSCPIPGGVQNGKMVIIQGVCHHHQNNFSINLCMTGQTSPLGDTAFHFNPRFHEQSIVRNHQQYNTWGPEERTGGMPLRKGTPFEIIILVDPNHYKVSINGRHFCNFRHRVAKEMVQYLVLVGEVNISYIKFEGGASPVPAGFVPPAGGYVPPPGAGYVPPPGAGYVPPPGAGYAVPGQPVYNPSVPYTASIPGGLYPGRMIYISGVPRPNISRFTINLMCGPSEQCDIGFTFDARFNYGGVYNQTVRNHKVGGSWGTEERHQTYFPFSVNTNFDMIILVEPTCIKVAVNNQHFTEFNHRIQPLNRINFLGVTGDVRLTSVRIQ